MIKKDTARCPDCTDRLGIAQKVVSEDGANFTLYLCPSCSTEWLRPHN